MNKFDTNNWVCDAQYEIKSFGGGPTPTPPPAVPPAASPPTLASSNVVGNSAQKQAQADASYGGTIQTGPEGVAPTSVSTAKQTLGGVT